MRPMRFPVYASLPSLGPGIPEVHRFLSFGRATLGFGRLVRPFHSVLSFRTLTASPSGLEDFHLQSIRLHLWRSIPESLVAAAILAAVEPWHPARRDGRPNSTRPWNCGCWSGRQDAGPTAVELRTVACLLLLLLLFVLLSNSLGRVRLRVRARARLCRPESDFILNSTAVGLGRGGAF